MLNDRLMTSLQTISRHPQLDVAAGILVKVAAMLSVLYLLSGYLALPMLSIFGHDEVHYYVDFHFKLVEDGRWLDYLLHDFLRSVPLPLWSIIYLFLFWLLFYRLARTYAFDAAYAVLVASTILVASPFMEISLWPASLMPALMLALLASHLQARGVAYQVIYLVSGVLIFGAMQTLYFLLPLLFLPHFLENNLPARSRWQLLFSHMCWWVGGSVAGVLFMSLMLQLLAGIYFPQPAEWRNTNPVVDWASLLENIRYVSISFVSQIESLLRLGAGSWGFIGVVAVAGLLRSRALLAQTHAWLLMAAVLLSFFVFSIPLGPVILTRSLIAMAAVVVLSLAMLPGHSALGRVLGALLLLKLSQNFSALCQDYLDVQQAETTVYMEKLRELVPGYPMKYSALALYGMMDPAQPEARRFNDPSLMHPLLVSLGVWDFLDCRIESRCDRVGVAGEPIAVLSFANGQLELSVDAANVGIIRYREGEQAEL
jgi:hypothetical protein